VQLELWAKTWCVSSALDLGGMVLVQRATQVVMQLCCFVKAALVESKSCHYVRNLWTSCSLYDSDAACTLVHSNYLVHYNLWWAASLQSPSNVQAPQLIPPCALDLWFKSFKSFKIWHTSNNGYHPVMTASLSSYCLSLSHNNCTCPSPCSHSGSKTFQLPYPHPGTLGPLPSLRALLPPSFSSTHTPYRAKSGPSPNCCNYHHRLQVRGSVCVCVCVCVLLVRARARMQTSVSSSS